MQDEIGHTWDDDSRFLRLDPIVRREVFHVQVVDGKMIRCGRAHWCKYLINDVGRVKALFEVGFGREVGCGSGSRGTTPTPRSSEVEPVSVVEPETTATSACVGKVQVTASGLFARLNLEVVKHFTPSSCLS